MSTHPATLHLRPAPTLPPAPSTTALHETLGVRLDALTRDVLPRLREEREFLAALWYSESADACYLHIGVGHTLAVDPRGADRLAAVLATEEALQREQVALRELLRALDDYASGGRQIRALLEDLSDDLGVAEDGDGVGVTPPSEWVAPPSIRRPQPPPEPTSAAGRAFTYRLSVYLATVEHDLAQAMMSGCAAEVEQYTLERDAVRERLAQRLGFVVPHGGTRAHRSLTRFPVPDSRIRRSA